MKRDRAVEHALFCHRVPDSLPEDYGRFYFGAEFCPWRFPSDDMLLDALNGCRRAGGGFTLVTPVLLEPFLPRLRHCLETLVPRMDGGDEIVISDLGALPLIRRIDPEVTIVLGRVLSGQKRGPRVLDLDLSADQLCYFQSGSWYGEEARRFLQQYDIGRVELDNLLQGIAPLPSGPAGSLHLPYAFVTSSRNCPFSRPGRTSCPPACGETFVLESDQTSVALYQAGNTQFLHNDALPDDLSGKGIDRLVHHPELPR